MEENHTHQPEGVIQGDLEFDCVIFDQDSIVSILKSVRWEGAPGPNGVLNAVFKYNREYWSRELSLLFSEVMAFNQVPRSWKGSILTPIYKAGSKDKASNYRLIALLDNEAKYFASLLLKDLNAWAENKHILAKNQTGFIRKVGTTTNIMALSFLIDQTREKGLQLHLCFVDYKSAFDKVQRGVLWDKLKSYEIPEVLLKGILLLYTNTWVRVRLGSGFSVSRKVYTVKGVKQGCVLAPFLFNIYLADLSKNLNKEESHSPKIGAHRVSNLMYADDVVLLSYTKIGLQRLIDGVEKYSERHALVINRSKTKLMTIGGLTKSKQIWFLKGKPLEKVLEYRYLGVIYDVKTRFKPHNEALRRKASALCIAFCKLRHRVVGPSLEPFLKIIEAKLAPSLSYGAEALREKNVALLDILIANTYRRVLSLPKNASSAQIRLELGNPSQEIVSLGTYAKTCHRLKGAPDGTLSKLLWDAINNAKGSQSNKYLMRAIETLGLELLWPMSVSEETFKKLVNKMVKKALCLKDKQSLAKRSHSWSVIGSYVLLKPQKYLRETFPVTVKIQLLTFRLGYFPVINNQLPWEKRKGLVECRLCGTGIESPLHILCSCPALICERKRYLKSGWNRLGIRTCRQALIACLSAEDIRLSGSCVKFMKLAATKIELHNNNCKKDARYYFELEED